MAKARGFTFFENYYEAISDPAAELSYEDQGMIYNAIITYIFTGEQIPLKGPILAIFKSLLPSLDNSRSHIQNGLQLKKKQTETISEMQTSENVETEQMEIKRVANGEQTESETQATCNQTPKDRVEYVENTPFYEKQETEKENNIYTPPACARPCEGNNIELDRFLLDHPNIDFDIFRHDEADQIREIDFSVLSEKMGESRILKECKSLSFLARNWKKIKNDGFKDFPSRAGKKENRESGVSQFSRLMGEYGDG